MRKFITILCFWLLVQFIYGQTCKQVIIPKYDNGDTTLWYIWQMQTEDVLKLPHLITDTSNFHFRFWNHNGQTIDIRTDDYKIFYGQLINYTNTYVEYNSEKKKNKPSVTYSQRLELDTSVARQTYELIKTIISIPTQDSIKGWYGGLDGITYIIETSTPKYYTYKDYWTPTAQDSTLIAPKQIQSFVNKIDSALNLRTEYQKFFATLKPGTYSCGNGIVTCKLTSKQVERWEKYKPYKDYLDSVRDTLNKYLCDTLTKIFQSNRVSISNHSYILKFSSKNRLKKIRTIEEFIDFSDRLDFYKNRRKIKKAFKHIHVNFVHSKVSYNKELNYWGNKVTIY